ncbi:MAG TPA: metallophosphoesterase family protein, partial [Pseudolabrys sp.]
TRTVIAEDAAIPNDNARLYVIGDIHGRLDLLERAAAAITRDVEAHGSDALTVTLGDYIDRGPESAGVIDRLAGNPFPTPYVALRGNHELMLEMFLADPAVGVQWRPQGGEQTLQSYGIAVRHVVGSANLQASELLREALPREHVAFLRSLRTSYTHGRFFLCHAGVRPGVPLDKQRDEDLMWIRDEFLVSTMDFGKIVVHGHTPMAEPEVLPNRINIDTKAFASGRLTCIVLEQTGYRFLQV